MSTFTKTTAKPSGKNLFRAIGMFTWCGVFFMLLGSIAGAQNPEVKVRCANPRYHCADHTYCVDVEFQCDTPNQQLFGMNVRLIYDDSILEFVAFSGFEGGYGPVSPNPPTKTTGTPASGPNLFTFTGAAEHINGAIQLVNSSAAPIYIPTDGWTKLFGMCFSIDNPAAIGIASFCPSIVWDLKANPADGGLWTPNGVVMTVVSASGGDSAPADERVEPLNWQYSGLPGTPYGAPVCTTPVSTEDCDDGNMCTEDICDPVTGNCIYEPIDCDDGDVCNGLETCDPATGCVDGTPLDCNDNNACTTDSCDALLGCQHADVNCDDENACTEDSCDPATGCVFKPITCDDEDACTE
ncbi:MAG TPA: hypothetical protein PLC40_07330, partial [Candidatus Hydrogenedentes bacterium]|nr:hypothetical protein [Candidatus Hydrogenedentota bacterium]